MRLLDSFRYLKKGATCVACRYSGTFSSVLPVYRKDNCRVSPRTLAAPARAHPQHRARVGRARRAVSVRPAWFKRYWPLLKEMSAHVTTVEAKMLKAIFYSDHAHSVTLKFTLVVVLASKADLHRLVHRDHRVATVEVEILKMTFYGDRVHGVALAGSRSPCLVRLPRVYSANPLANQATTLGSGTLFCGLAPLMDALIVARAFAGKGGSRTPRPNYSVTTVTTTTSPTTVTRTSTVTSTSTTTSTGTRTSVERTTTTPVVTSTRSVSSTSTETETVPGTRTVTSTATEFTTATVPTYTFDPRTTATRQRG
ncbi:hypothetical protein VTO73DRAFT_8974 [Trametes versicolor]